VEEQSGEDIRQGEEGKESENVKLIPTRKARLYVMYIPTVVFAESYHMGFHPVTPSSLQKKIEFLIRGADCSKRCG
jgi:hypothetical protein